MTSFFSKLASLFSGGGREAPPARAVEPQDYAGHRIFAAPIREGSQFRLAGRIEKEVDGEVLTRTFIRADIFTTEDDAVEFTFRKGRQIVDQSGGSLFTDGEKSANI